MQEDGTFDFGEGAKLHASSQPTGQGPGNLREGGRLVYAVAAKVFHIVQGHQLTKRTAWRAFAR
jgi:hypothetical protein